MAREDALDAAFDLLKEVLDELGAGTGVIAYHPYRTEEDGDHHDGRGVWKDLLPAQDESREWSKTREDVVHEPHFHAVVLSPYVAGGEVTKLIEKRTGWVVERITQKSNPNVSIYGQFDLARVLTYVLSHTGIRRDESRDRARAAYRYYGEVANFSATDEIVDEFDAVVRSVAPRTLGLKYDSLACLETRGKEVAGPDQAVDPVEAEASRSSPSTSSSSSDDPEGDGAIVEYELEDACKGRLLDITQAPKYLEDPEWRAEADHVEDLQSTWDEWRDQIDEPPD